MNLKILEYHKFGENYDPYQYSRTYSQFIQDLEQSFDWITMDDGHAGQLKACELLRERNIRGKLSINLEFIGKPGYLNWENIEEISKYHDIENHGTIHVWHTHLTRDEIVASIDRANTEIYAHTGRIPRYFIPPFNQTDHVVEEIAHRLGLKVISGRETVRNKTIW